MPPPGMMGMNMMAQGMQQGMLSGMQPMMMGNPMQMPMMPGMPGMPPGRGSTMERSGMGCSS